MQVLKTIKTNWRDIVVCLGLTLGLALAADVLERVAITNEGQVWLANVVISLRGLAAFAGANLAAFFMLAVAWPTINAFSNDSFNLGWNSLSHKEHFYVFVAVALGYIVSASICFAP